MFGICTLSNIPLRSEPSDKSEMVSQVLFGEHFEIVEKLKQWVKIKLQFDAYEGWIDEKQLQVIDADDFENLSKEKPILNGDLVAFIAGNNNFLMPIQLGASLTFLKNPKINSNNLIFEGQEVIGVKQKSAIVETALLYLNAPYLWGGKSLFGIDCSGFSAPQIRCI